MPGASFRRSPTAWRASAWFRDAGGKREPLGLGAGVLGSQPHVLMLMSFIDPNMQVTHLGAGVLTIDGFLSPQECSRLIASSEAMGYEEAAIRTEAGERLYKEARNNDRIIFDDGPLALQLYRRAQPCLPAQLDGWTLSGLNSRWRYYRYGPGQQFTWHQDGTVRLSAEEETFLTFMIYLNADFQGGSTDFGWDSVQPVPGRVLVFPHRLRHRGASVIKGVKYVLRSDVLYASQPRPPAAAGGCGGEAD